MNTDILNRPGLSQLEYRIGTFGSFLNNMKARLAAAGHPELAALTTRDGSDPSIALLDAWAIVADVLTFYQERIANEGFLRTATEKRSVFELARLVGFKPRPGVAASVALAYVLEKDARLTIGKGSRSQSVPGPGELPQTYETCQDLVARAEWNHLVPRLTIPQTIGDQTKVLYFKGAGLGLKAYDPLMFVQRAPDGAGRPATESFFKLVRIHSVEESFDKGLTTVVLDPPPPEPFGAKALTFSETAFEVARRLRERASPSSQTPDAQRPETSSLLSSSALGEVLSELNPRLPLEELNAAARAEAPGSPAMDVYGFRVHSAPFGHNAPKRPVFGVPDTDSRNRDEDQERSLIGYEEWTLEISKQSVTSGGLTTTVSEFEDSTSITLASTHENIVPRSWVAILRPSPDPPEGPSEQTLLVYRAQSVEEVSRADYGVAARATRIALEPAAMATDGTVPMDGNIPNVAHTAAFSKGWLAPELRPVAILVGVPAPPVFRAIRKTTVYAQSERLELAGLPVYEPVRGDSIELDSLHDGIDEGRLLIVEGERADVLSDPPGKGEIEAKEATGEPLKIVSSGVRSAELARVAAVVPDASHGPNDTSHSRVLLTAALAHAYKRDTVTIHGNVVVATHGETRNEVLGSGDATQPYQTFAMRQAPITFVSAATPSGAASTVELRVNDIAWHEVDDLVGAGADERVFVAELDEKGGARVIFGNGRGGARVPTGVENVKARYRVGIGAAGNAQPGHVSQLMDRPLGAKEVSNPLPARGGGDPDTPDQARAIAPLSVKALDRLVSVSDYRDFAQLFAGIAKATVSEEGTGASQKIVVTVAASGGQSIADSGLHGSLSAALRRFGDPSRVVEVVDFARHLLVIEAGVRLLPDYLFDSVNTRLRFALFDAFSFDRRRLGDDLPLAHVLAVMQSVEGVHSVDVDVFGTITATDVESATKLADKITQLQGTGLPPQRLPDPATIQPAVAADRNHVQPERLVYASPRVPSTLRLREIS